ncbi:MAG TPA: RdgB/HAM1 family non-canonical purine NTP pyrophosphatase [Anaerolineales bacterium]|nr:RdgB/HAM1 family non-canonical purine NTP pyrophosphatase [Anaerolineales bacterium]
MRKLLLASDNPGKIREFQELLKGLPFEIVTPKKLGIQQAIAEVGKSYAENAAIKAQHYVQASGLLTLADDSGLEVQALGGLPGIRSARYSPELGASDADRRKYLLDQLQSHSRPWPARFLCTLALATIDAGVYFTEGECLGEIIPHERGSNGFGYDPIFLISDLNRTMAELTTPEKNRLSHRARAVKKMIPILENIK